MKRSLPFVLAVCFVFVIAFFQASIVFAQNDRGQATEPSREKNAAYVSGLTSGRAKSLIGVVIGLSSLVIGWRAKIRSRAKTNNARSWSIAGLVLGIVAIILSAIHLANNTGGFGTGGGKAGAIVAIVLGVTGAVFSGLAFRSRPDA
jgi:heme/copper-type cytochrome/quinol oxidase subunit 3